MTYLSEKQSPFFLFALCLPLIVSTIDLMAVSIAIHPIMQQLSLSLSAAQWIMSAYTIGNAAFVISIGKFADVYGRRTIFCTGIVIFMAASLIGACSHTILTLIIARFLQGIACATLLMSSIAIITSHYSKEARGSVISKWGLAISLGMICGPFVGGVIIMVSNWQMIFWVNIPICFVSLLLANMMIPTEKQIAQKNTINYVSISLLSIALISLLYTLTLLQNKSNGIFLLITSFILSIAFCIAFIFYDTSSKNPLIAFSLFKISQFIKPALSGFISYFCMYGWLTIIGIYLQKNLGMTAFQAGAWCLFFSLGFACSTKLNIVILRRWSSETLLTLGWTVMTTDILMMYFNRTNHFLSLMSALFFLLGIGIGMTNTGSMTSALKPITPNQSGVASGILFTIRWIGGAVGVVFAATLFALDGLSAAYLGLFLTCVAGVPLLRVRPTF